MRIIGFEALQNVILALTGYGWGHISDRRLFRLAMERSPLRKALVAAGVAGT